MTIEATLKARSDSKCELCSSPDNLNVYEVPKDSSSGSNSDECVLVCETCNGQLQNPDTIDVHHWRCLNDSMWNENAAVQVVAWRMLNRLSSDETWAQDLLDMLYLDDELLEWARAGQSTSDAVKHVDSNGTTLASGDNVTLIKDLDVKGANFTAKRGTAVRGISLVHDNAEHIEGRVNGQRIVILTKFVKKSG